MSDRPEPGIIEALRDRLEGELLLPGDPGYDGARRVWNGRFDPHPDVIVRCRSTADVAAAVGAAHESGQPLSVKGGGHGYAGHAIGDGLAIDLSSMNGVRVDAERRRALVGPGAVWGALDRETQAHGLATTGATVSTVGVAGYTLGGGTGYLARMHGLGLDNLVSAEVVTAAGEAVRASDDENADLFWALRGGSGNFGVVTSLEFRLHEVGPEVVTAQAFHPMERAPDVLRFYRTFMNGASEEVTAYVFALRVPPADPFPADRHGAPAIALVACHCGDVNRGEEELRLLEKFGDPFFAGLQRVPYTAAQQAFDAGMPSGLRWYSRAHYLHSLSDGVIETMVEYVESLPGPFTMAYLEPLGGEIARIDGGATAFPHRTAPFSIHILPGWNDPADDESLMSWAREFHTAMARHSTGGVYVNLLSRDQADGARAAWGENYDRLARVKAKWDARNLFVFNHNIPPQP